MTPFKYNVIMQSNILKTTIGLVALLLISSCSNKNELKNQITIEINSIDSETKQARVNMFDSVIVRKEGIGYLMKTFETVGEYVTDSTGSVKIKIDRTEKYQISLYGFHAYGGDYFDKEELKDGQELNIEVVPNLHND